MQPLTDKSRASGYHPYRPGPKLLSLRAARQAQRYLAGVKKRTPGTLFLYTVPCRRTIEKPPGGVKTTILHKPGNIKPADKLLTFVIPSRIGVRDDDQAGHAVQFFKSNGAIVSAIQRYYWIPDQVRHDGPRLSSVRPQMVDFGSEQEQEYD
jgi:hypothetical protein